MMRARKLVRTTAMLGICLTLSGCFYGPQGLHVTRPEYNDVLKRSAEEEMLLNIVRLKYRETPEFLGVPSVIESLSFAGGGGGNAGFTPHRLSSWGLNGNASFRESPTISYAPLQDEQFNKRLLSPVSLEVLDLLAETGWDVSRVFRLITKNINDVDNATSAGGPTPEIAPDYADFHSATWMMRELQKQRLLEITHKLTSKSVQSEDEDGNKVEKQQFTEQIGMRIDPKALESPEAKAIKELFHLGELDKPGHDDPGFVPFLSASTGQIERRGKQHDDLQISNRSFLEVMYFLSQGICIPDEHYQQGLITITQDINGNFFDWQNVTGELLKVYVTDKEPADAAVAVEYRGYWYYIYDSDLNSKSTFNLLLELYNIAIRGGAVGQTPVLTQGV